MTAVLATIVIDLDPNLVRLGPFLVTWHGVFSVLGILAAARLAQVLLKREGFSADRVYDLAVWMVVAGIIGARVFYVVENHSQFAGGPWYKALLLNEGGISQWGGIFGGLVGLALWCRVNRQPFLKVLDVTGPANAIGFFIGRIGDVINGEHHAIGTNLPWGVEYVNEHTLGQPGRAVHPEVAYEMVLCLVLLAALMPFFRRMTDRLPTGVTGLIWLSLYAIGRTLLSFLREDQLFFGLRQAQWAGIAMVVISAVAIPILYLRRRRSDPTLPDEPAAAAA